MWCCSIFSFLCCVMSTIVCLYVFVSVGILSSNSCFWLAFTYPHLGIASVTLLQTRGAWVAQWDRSFDLTTHTSLWPIWRGFAPRFVITKKGALDSQPKVIKFTSCLPMAVGSIRILRLHPPLRLVAII